MTCLDASINSSDLSCQKLTALHLAVLGDSYHDVRKIVGEREHGIDERTLNGTTSLMLAALYGRIRIFTFLTRKKASTHKKDNHGHDVMAYVKRESPFLRDLLRKYNGIVTSYADRAGRREIYGWLKVIKHASKIAYGKGFSDGRDWVKSEAQIQAPANKDGPISQQPSQDVSARLAFLRSLNGKQQKFVEVKCIATAEHCRIGRKCTAFIYAAGIDDAPKFAISGWGRAEDENAVFKNVLKSKKYTELVRRVAEALDFELKSNYLDSRFPGSPSEKKGAYFACHAEKQLAVFVLLKVLAHVFGTKALTTSNMTNLKAHLEKLPTGLRNTTIHLDHEMVCGNCVQFLKMLTEKTGLVFRCQSNDWFVYGERPQLRRMPDGSYAQTTQATRPSGTNSDTEIIDDEIDIFDSISNTDTVLQSVSMDTKGDSLMGQDNTVASSTPSNHRPGSKRQRTSGESPDYLRKGSSVSEEPEPNTMRYSIPNVTPPSWWKPHALPTPQSRPRIVSSPSPAGASSSCSQQQQRASLSMSQEYEVEDILQTKEEDGVRWFLIKWKAFPHDSNTWEPEANLSNASDVINKFWKELQESQYEVRNLDT